MCAVRHERPSGRFSKSRGLSASVSFLPLPHLLIFALAPFSRGQNAETPVLRFFFALCFTETLATQAMAQVLAQPRSQGLFPILSAPRTQDREKALGTRLVLAHVLAQVLTRVLARDLARFLTRVLARLLARVLSRVLAQWLKSWLNVSSPSSMAQVLAQCLES